MRHLVERSVLGRLPLLYLFLFWFDNWRRIGHRHITLPLCVAVLAAVAKKIVSEELEKLNKKIVKEVKDLKGDVIGLRGDENIVQVEKKKASKDLGFVGTITDVNTEAIEAHLKKGHIVVLSPMGVGTDKQLHNVNADEAASAVAAAMQAEKLVLLTNVHGVMRTIEDPDSLISTLTIDEIGSLIEHNVIQSGMIPKVNACVEALKSGVKKTHVIDARIQHGLLLEFFTDQGIGTQILKG